MRALALGGVVGPALFVGVVVVAASLRPDYSHLTNFVSELGATGTPRAAWMNYAAFLPAGLLLAGLGVALGRAMPSGPLAWIGTGLVVVFGLGVAASGVFSCDAGCPRSGGSLENAIHDRIAPIAFVSLIVAAGLLGLVFRREPAWRGLAVFSFAASLVGLGLLIGLVGSLDTRILTGLWQRLLIAVLFTWCAVVGLRAHRLGAPA